MFSIDMNILSAIIIWNFYCIFVLAQILFHSRLCALGIAHGEILYLKLLALISSRIGNSFYTEKHYTKWLISEINLHLLYEF